MGAHQTIEEEFQTYGSTNQTTQKELTTQQPAIIVQNVEGSGEGVVGHGDLTRKS